MSAIPPEVVQEAFIAPASRIVRRVEIYESDSVTPWRNDLWDKILVNGSVSASSGDEERRTFECTLDNTEGDLDPVAGGLWYDKTFKIFYGIMLDQVERDPRVIVVEEYNATGQFLALKSMLSKQGIKIVQFNETATTYTEIQDFDIVVSISSTVPQKTSLLNTAYAKGKSVLTLCTQASSAELPYIIGTSAGSLTSATTSLGYYQTNTLHPVMLGWEPWTVINSVQYRKIITAAVGTQVLAYMNDGVNGSSPAVITANPMDGPKWLHMQQSKFDLASFDTTDSYNDCAAFLGRAVMWLDNYEPYEYWETQIGEFLSDSIEDASPVGDLIKVTGRDYTKRCLKSKFSKATTFRSAQPIEEIISALAINSGISKINLPVTSKILGKDQTWERDTERWAVMLEIAKANNYELYFNAEGYLTMREYRDPLLTAPTLVLRTGIGGNLVSRGAKTSDGELFNHVTVVGESSDSTTPLVFGEAINNNPASPARVGTPGTPGGIGDRVSNITSSVITTSFQAQALADSLLSVSSLEEFELNFSSVLLPWIEPGDIVEMDETESDYWGPSRYLISSLTLPLDLGPMSGTGKRVTKVL